MTHTQTPALLGGQVAGCQDENATGARTHTHTGYNGRPLSWWPALWRPGLQTRQNWKADRHAWHTKTTSWRPGRGLPGYYRM